MFLMGETSGEGLYAFLSNVRLSYFVVRKIGLYPLGTVFPTQGCFLVRGASSKFVRLRNRLLGNGKHSHYQEHAPHFGDSLYRALEQ